QIVDAFSGFTHGAEWIITRLKRILFGRLERVLFCRFGWFDFRRLEGVFLGVGVCFPEKSDGAPRFPGGARNVGIAIECNWLQCRYTGRGAVVLQELAGLGAKIGVWVTEAGLDSLFSRRADLLERIESCGAVEEVAQLADEEFCTLSRAEFA